MARSHLFVWLRRVREEGIEAMLAREKPGPKKGPRRRVTPEVMAALAEQMEAHKPERRD